ncbi:trafficking kinesin-binding protein 1 isoform X2 [Denticeps clupeoides]|uniref:Uncharacterized protein n=1 Tax=Denticeps clupeoides TaxID=299321 RepID=A0AAY4DF07_9TELE|nr:trafficking kinesin-binding protein 1-like isoform X2 [Denticeps clupeoides]
MDKVFGPVVTMEVWSSSATEESEKLSSSSSCSSSQSEGDEELEDEDLPVLQTDALCRELMQVLCSERVGQVTKAYHDIEAVTHLLEEKERDLELAARIGQSLLKQNKDLTERNELLDEQLEIAKEEIAQLRHELSMRDDLLHLYVSTEELEAASESHSHIKRKELTPSLADHINHDFLRQKLKGLEEENLKLRSEANALASETTDYEEQEQQLMMVCVEELSSVNKQVVDLSEELARKMEDCVRQQEEISSLLSQIVDLQQRCKSLSNENEELVQHLSASREYQTQLKIELRELQEKCSECEDMLQEAREDIKNLRNKSLPNSTVQRYSALSTVFPMDSLAAEIEGTFRKGIDSPAPLEYKSHPWRVFETVKMVNQAARLRSQCQSPQVPGSGSPASSCSSHNSTPRTSYYGSDGASRDDKPARSNMDLPADPSVGDNRRVLGQPGMPGGHDLAAALRSLSARQENHASERPFFDVERERKLSSLALQGGEGGDGSSGFLTPSSSTGTNYSGSSRHTSRSGNSSTSRSCLPDRLQIVKPLEGSATLHHWQQLAKPDLGSILQSRPGVLTKDFRQLDVDLQHIYSLNDLEEDEEEPDLARFTTGAHSTIVGISPSMVKVTPSSPIPSETPPIHTTTNRRYLHPSLFFPYFNTSARKHWL